MIAGFMNTILGIMTKKDIRKAINQALNLAMLDMVDQDIDSMSHHEIAKRTGMSVKDVRNAEDRAIAKLKASPIAKEALAILFGKGTRI
jgi:DNA-directed RNA polymerase specialized sigma24 family protein